ncbi:MAG: hypothetical protein IKG74_02485 [Firmicutes bacterium]|nr:hypothetical protein [Bacillota bacterium]
MKQAIGFSNRPDQDPAPVEQAPPAAAAPVRCVAEVHFPSVDKQYGYYNDLFDLKVGDAVFVSGKFAGKLGFVTSVTTRFKVDLAYFKKVIAKPDIRFSGSFVPVLSMMLSPGSAAFPDAAAFGGWVKPPQEGESINQIVTGDGFAFDLEDFEQDDEVEEAAVSRALEYCREGRVRYLSLQNGVGTAFVEGSVWYEVNFRYVEGRVWDMYCDCPCPGLCKHDIAVLIVLRALLRQPELFGESDFVAIDQGFFSKIVSMNRQSVVLE